MRWTRGVASAGVVLALAGCGYGYRTTAVQARYSTDSRPDASYFCYDCHGYRYFDPYYDYCSNYGFKYRWADHPRSMVVYRDRYVRIKENHPDYGRYRYREGYRATTRYREPVDYEGWRSGVKPAASTEARKGGKSKDRDQQGSGKQRKGDQGKGPRDFGSRLTLPGGGA